MRSKDERLRAVGKLFETSSFTFCESYSANGNGKGRLPRCCIKWLGQDFVGINLRVDLTK